MRREFASEMIPTNKKTAESLLIMDTLDEVEAEDGEGDNDDDGNNVGIDNDEGMDQSNKRCARSENAACCVVLIAPRYFSKNLVNPSSFATDPLVESRGYSVEQK